MFDFFKEAIEKIGIKLVSDFTVKLIDFIKNVKEESDANNNDNGQDYKKIGSSGDRARIGSSGDGAQIGSSGVGARGGR